MVEERLEIHEIVGGCAPWEGWQGGVRGGEYVEIRHVSQEEKLGDCSLVTREKTSALAMEAVPGEDWGGFVAVMGGLSGEAKCFNRKLSDSGGQEGNEIKDTKRTVSKTATMK